MLKTQYLSENDCDTMAQLLSSEPDMQIHIDFEPDDIDDSGFFIGLFNNNNLIGVCTIGSADCETDDIYNECDCILSNVYIKETERCKGYGRRMVKDALRLACEQYGNNVACHIDILQPELANWYETLGFNATLTDDFGVAAMAVNLSDIDT